MTKLKKTLHGPHLAEEQNLTCLMRFTMLIQLEYRVKQRLLTEI